MPSAKDRPLEDIRFKMAMTLPGSLKEFIDELIWRAVKECGTQARAAAYLGVTPATISRRLNRRRGASRIR
jgi:CRP-like cAMP-binding protein